MLTLVIFIAVLAVLVLSHEWGHFILARKNGMKVEEFGFGFPPRMLGLRRFKKGKWQVVWGGRKIRAELQAGKSDQPTLYSINWLPLGGFVKIKGEDSIDPNAKDKDSFASKRAWRKTSVLVAGVLMNVVVAAVLLSVGFMIGLPQVAGVDNNDLLSDRQVQIIQVLPDLPAEKAGVMAGDIVTLVNGQRITRLDQLQYLVDVNKEKKIKVEITRAGELVELEITPTIYPDTGRGGLGVAIAEIGLAKYPWYQAIYYGIITTVIYLKEIVIAFFFLIKGLLTGAGVGASVSGPVGVAVMTGQVARLGLVHLLQFTALLSLNLAVLNILPIPALDGGRLFFVIIGKIMGQPVSPKIEQRAHTIGFMLLMFLVIAVTVKDLSSFGGTFIDLIEKVF